MHQTYLTKCAHVEPKTERVYAPGWRLRAPVCASSTSPRWSSWRRSPERDSLLFFFSFWRQTLLAHDRRVLRVICVHIMLSDCVMATSCTPREAL